MSLPEGPSQRLRFGGRMPQLPCLLLQYHGYGSLWAEVRTQTASFAVEKIYDGLIGDWILGDGLVRADELADLAALAYVQGKASGRFFPGLFGCKR